MPPPELPTAYAAEAAHADERPGLRTSALLRAHAHAHERPGHRATAILQARAILPPSLWESVKPRLISGAAVAVFVVFMYVLMSFLFPLRPAFTTTEVFLFLALIALVIARP